MLWTVSMLLIFEAFRASYRLRRQERGRPATGTKLSWRYSRIRIIPSVQADRDLVK